jgi:hypothetical protein
MVVKQIGGDWVMLFSYWDNGFVQLNVNNPANPMLIGDTDYTDPDPELLESTGAMLASEGNGHQNEFTPISISSLARMKTLPLITRATS